MVSPWPSVGGPPYCVLCNDLTCRCEPNQRAVHDPTFTRCLLLTSFTYARGGPLLVCRRSESEFAREGARSLCKASFSRLSPLVTHTTRDGRWASAA